MARTRVALLIGVSDYSAFDRARELAPGTSNLPAPPNDVRWMYRQCLRLGYNPRNIVVCTSPPVDTVALGLPSGSPNVRGATAKEILSALAGIQGKGKSGLVYYAGHGAVDDEGHLLLCPSDTGWDGKELTNTLRLDDLSDRLAAGTEVVLDTCHAGAGRSLTPDRAVPVDAVRFPDKYLLAACGSHETAEERVFHGEWHGAFTFALTSLLDQWQVETGGRRSFVPVTHEQLCLRSRAILGALGSAQRPVYAGLPGVVFGGIPGAPSAKPNAPVISEQVWSGDSIGYKEFRIQVNGANVGWYVTFGSNFNVNTLPTAWRTVFQAGWEYWYWQAGQSPFPPSFTLVPQGGWNSNTPTSGWISMPCSPIPTSPASWTPPGGAWKITLTGSSSVYYMSRAQVGNAWQQSWFAQGAGSIYIGNGTQTLTFATNASPTGSWGRLQQMESTS